VNPKATVTDTFNSVKSTLGTLTASDTTPYASATYTYSHTVNVPTWNCVSYTNTAKIVETGPAVGEQDSRGVRPGEDGCADDRLLAEQERPGHHHRSGSYRCVPVGDVAAVLRPVPGPLVDGDLRAGRDLRPNVIKAANASGASMNAMLKAQMLFHRA
jgi:hypothetical protein